MRAILFIAASFTSLLSAGEPLSVFYKSGYQVTCAQTYQVVNETADQACQKINKASVATVSLHYNGINLLKGATPAPTVGYQATCCALVDATGKVPMNDARTRGLYLTRMEISSYAGVDADSACKANNADVALYQLVNEGSNVHTKYFFPSIRPLVLGGATAICLKVTEGVVR